MIARADRAGQVQRIAYRRVISERQTALEFRAVNKLGAVEILGLARSVRSVVIIDPRLQIQRIGGERQSGRRTDRQFALDAISLGIGNIVEPRESGVDRIGEIGADLLVAIIIIESGQIRLHHAVGERRLHAHFIGGQLFLLHRRILAREVCGVDRRGARFIATRDRCVEQGVVVRRPVERDAPRDIIFLEQRLHLAKGPGRGIEGVALSLCDLRREHAIGLQIQRAVHDIDVRQHIAVEVARAAIVALLVFGIAHPDGQLQLFGQFGIGIGKDTPCRGANPADILIGAEGLAELERRISGRVEQRAGEQRCPRSADQPDIGILAEQRPV